VNRLVVGGNNRILSEAASEVKCLEKANDFNGLQPSLIGSISDR
jgi:hypothetical protein